MPDRPAGAVEGAQDTHAPEIGALEAIMAAVLFRPAPAPQTDGVMPAVSAASSVMAPGASPAPVTGVMEAQAGIALLRQVNASAMDAGEAPAATDAPAVAPDAAVEAMRIAAQTAQRFVPVRSKTDGGTSDADLLSPSDGEMAAASELPDGTAPPAVTPSVAASVDPVETVAALLAAVDGISDVEAVEVFTPVVTPQGRGAVPGDGAEAPETGGQPARAALALNLSPVTDVANASPAAVTKAGVQSLPVAAQVAETVRAAVLRGDHEVRLLLNPGDLGRIDIRITQRDGVLHLRMDATHGATRDLLAREMPVLQQALEARDLRVERIQVSHSGAASADGSSAWQQGFGRQRQQREGDGAPAWSPVAGFGGTPSANDEAHRAPRLIRHQGVLDRVA